MRYVNVAVGTPVKTLFTYKVECGGDLCPGMRVLVPFRGREKIGVCMDVLGEAPSSIVKEKIKSVDAILEEEPCLSENLLRFISWIAEYYIAPIGEVVRVALPSRFLDPAAPRTTRPTEPQDIKAIAGPRIILTNDQKAAFESIMSAEGRAEVILLDGVTGSGKTEVYLSVFEEMIGHGKSCLLLVPEIGLTPQLVGCAAARFGKRVAVYHSGLTDAQRHAQWLRIHKGVARVVIGTRSALFAPIKNLGVIVVDEEHDGSYKQDDGVAYHARDSAVMRSHMENIPIVLGSATPSAESVENVRKGKYKSCHLSERPGGAKLPVVEVVDMREERRSEFVALSQSLYDALDRNLKVGEQSLIFVGRRGFAGAMQCAACGFIPICPNCDISLTMHRLRFSRPDPFLSSGNLKKALVCHYCGYDIAEPEKCPECAALELVPIGQGTERVEAELKDFFPDARVARFDSDTVTRASERRRILDDMRQRKIDILIGTQMVTKGHDFPFVTLVGVVAADMQLGLPDFRASERTFQLMTQVAGRAGRGEKPGRVIIQTYRPDHISFIAAKDHDTKMFAGQELSHRKTVGYPPFARLANIKISATDEKISQKTANQVFNIINCIKKDICDGNRMEILGPAPAPLFKLRGRFRWQMLIKAPSAAILRGLLSRANENLFKCLPRKARLSIDVDPINLL